MKRTNKGGGGEMRGRRKGREELKTEMRKGEEEKEMEKRKK